MNADLAPDRPLALPENHDRNIAFPSGLSPSSMATWQQCQVRWAYEKVVRIPTVGSIATIVGTHVHRVLELVMSEPGPKRQLRYALATNSALLQTLLTVVAEYHDQIDPSPQPHTIDRAAVAELAGAAKNDGHIVAAATETLEVDPDPVELIMRTTAGVAAYFEMSKNPAAVDVANVELAISHTLKAPSGSVPVRGIIDRLDRLPTGELMPVDYKTGKAPDRAFDDGKGRQQLVFYAMLIRAVLQAVPTRGLLLYLGNKQADLATITSEQIDAFETQVERTWAEMRNRHDAGLRYRPSPGPLCGWCPFVTMCPEGEAEVRRRANTNGAGRGGVRADAPARAALNLPVEAVPVATGTGPVLTGR